MQISIEQSLDEWDKADNKLRCEFLHRVHFAKGEWQENWDGEMMTAAIAGHFRDKAKRKR